MRRKLLIVIAVSSLLAAVSVSNLFADTSKSGSAELLELQSKAVEFCKTQRVSEALPTHAFTTDRCSVWPDGDWYSCCVEHDYAYWCGGSAQQRAQADKQLKHCIKAKGYPVMGKIMRWGVRLGGHSVFPLPWRWGYGWDWPEDGS